MSKKKNQFNNLLINGEDKPSRFVVDLKQPAKEGELIKNQEKRIKLKQYFEKLVELDSGKILSSVKSNIRNTFEQCQKLNYLPINAKALSLPAPVFSRHCQCRFLACQEKLNQLAFFSLLKLMIITIGKLGKLFYQLCYGTGWFTVFLIRFVYLVSLALIKAVFPVIKKAVGKIKSLIFQIYVIVVRGIRKLGSMIYKFWLESVKRAKAIRRQAVQKLQEIKDIGRKISPESLELKKIVPQPSAKLIKPVLLFALTLVVLILPFKAYTYYKSFSQSLENVRGNVLGVSEEAVNDLFSASQSAAQLDFNQASKKFLRAGDNFIKAQNELDGINELLFALASIAPQKDIRLAANSRHILVAGEIAASLGNNLSLAINSLFNNKDRALMEVLVNFNQHCNKAIADIEKLKIQLNQIDVAVLPTQYQDQFLQLQKKINIIEKSLSEFNDLVDKMQIFLGVNQDKRYLLVFQNNAELRATGGFIGSFALVDLRDGKIKNIEAPGGGSYDTEAGLKVQLVAPEPLHLVNPLWHFWDANWWPDWPTSARKLMWFYEKSDGPTVDGVISFTPTVIESLLKIIGPINMEEDYGVIINADNFWITVQEIAEQKPDITRQPKKIVGDLMTKIIDQLPSRLNKDNLADLLSIVEESLNEKHILFYFIDNDLQKKIADLGWDGKIRQSSWDYLSVINTNIAGGKSDRRIKEIINHNAEIMPNGSIVNTVEIKRIHTGLKGEPFCGLRNVDWMRIYVPLGSELIEAYGFEKPDDIYFEKPDINWQNDPDLYGEEIVSKIHQPSGTKIYDEAGKTVFANWSMVDPGQTITIYLKYKLPFRLYKKDDENFWQRLQNIFNPTQKQLFPYTLLVQKQSGSRPSQINSTLTLPNNFKIVWRYPEGLLTTNNSWQINDYLNTDKYWAVLLEL